ncbi:WD40 repeat-containing protein [Cavenderia fasciculata]|uniref:WD40 repeat-containing protein n=1 Tax=Cavenderia fasciculata TaxID=261658 RepID=F4QE86_CACFS|nr:WD40 repeat-containing protein [Cavenderia fasciculata]EGG14033.1 WD40 repeat-containing protein [Cavenderia fasciculata]|eukprot:XP_004350741.1 WD40 repeat-containing protein [Cavenderia fasciculata]
MGQSISKEVLKEEIEKLNICFLSQHQLDLHINNIATACSQKGSVEQYYKLLSKKKDNHYIDQLVQLLEKSVLLSKQQQPQQQQPLTLKSEQVEKNIKKEESDDDDDIDTKKKKNTLNQKYEINTKESAAFEGDEILVQLLQKDCSNQSFDPIIFERVFVQQSVNQQYKPQPNEYLTSWEYFDELNSTPIFYHINPLYNMINADNYRVQEKKLKGYHHDEKISREFINLILQSFSTYISPLPNSIHFHDSSIPPSIDYSAPNLLKLHPNILPILEVIESEENFFLLYKKYSYTLDGLLRYSSQFLQKNSKISAFILYQLVQLIGHLHEKEMVHGNLTPSSVYLNDKMWLGLHGFSFPNQSIPYSPSDQNAFDGAVTRWINGEISNYNYLMLLNHLAHRRIGDHMNHPVLPWVIDFTKHPQQSFSCWRDLTKTKYRLNKGDEQLDFQYNNMNMDGRPHHISDILSELTYYSYMARRTPIPLLRRFVRANYEPQEYPSTMERLYRWTPDECIPEFFTDPTIFDSIHADMPDLAIPDWALSREEFIKIHMAALESDQVGKNLHSWIDLTFGYLLSGDEAIRAKNVALVDTTVPRTSGIVQLFTVPHPQKLPKHHNLEQSFTEPILKFKDPISSITTSSSSVGNSSTKQETDQLSSSGNIINLSGVVSTNTSGNTSGGGQNSTSTTLSPPQNSSSNNNTINNNSSFTSIGGGNSSFSATSGSIGGGTQRGGNVVSTNTKLPTKREDSNKSFSKYLPNIFQNNQNNNQNLSSSDPLYNSNIINDYQQQPPPPTSKSSNSVQHGRDERRYSSIISTLTSFTTAKTPTKSSSEDVLSPPTSPMNSSEINQQQQQQQQNTSSLPQRSMTPPTVGNEPVHIIEPLPADIEFNLYDYENKYHQQQQEKLGLQSSFNNWESVLRDQSQLNHNNSNDIFVEQLCKCENTQTFIHSFQNLSPIYKPMEFNKTNIKLPEILNYLTKRETKMLEILKSADMFAIGCIIAELHQGYPLFTPLTIENHFNQYYQQQSQQMGQQQKTRNRHQQSVSFNLPTPIRELVDRLVIPDPNERISPKEILSSPMFPSYFKQMYHFLCHYHSFNTPEEKLTFTLANIGIVTSLPNEAMDIILPFILELFNHPNTKVSALVDLLDPLSQRLGPLLSQTYLLPSLIHLHQLHDDHLVQSHLIQIPLIDMIISRFGRDIYIHHILPFLLESIRTNPRENPNHEILVTALIKLTKVLGVPLTIRHIMYPLLVALTKPHLQHISEPLIAIASSLGESIIIKFYFPAIFTLIQKHSSKATRSESIPCTLLSLLQELILLVKPGLVLRSLLKESTQLASLLLNPPNPSLLIPLSQTILRISRRIGILKYLQQFFSNYSDLYKFSDDGSEDNDSNKQLKAIYSPEMTYYLYYKLSRIIGMEIMRSEISDNALVEHIMMKYIHRNNLKPDPPPTTSIPPYVSDEGLFEDIEPTLDEKISSTYTLDDYQEFDDLITEQTITLDGNVVAQFKEHTAAIRSLAVFPSESIFATGSKDNLVKIWSLDSSRSLCTYNQHIHTTHSVYFVSNLVASCDSTSIHIWDAESKIRVNLFVDPAGNFSCFEPITNKFLVAPSSENTLSFLDLNVGLETHSWVLPYTSIRCITTSNDHFIPSDSHSLLSNPPMVYPSWIAAGSQSGVITILDTRTGAILDSWKTGDGPVIKLIGQGERYLISCSEKSVIQWDLSTSPPSITKLWKGFKDSVNSVTLWKNDIVAAAGHKLNSMSLTDDLTMSMGGYSVVNTFKSEGIKLNTPKQSTISNISFLPLHHLLLAGSDDGTIKLLL